MASKKSFLFGLLVFLLPLCSQSQVVQYFNRHYIAIQDTTAFKPVYYLLLDNKDQKSISKYFRMDNSLALEQINEKDASGKVIQRNSARFTNEGFLSSKSFRDYVKDSVVEKTFYPNGNLKSSKTTVKNEVLENTSFDEDGTPKPAQVSENAHPVGGMVSWRNFLIQNLEYPKHLIKEEVEGKADIFFELNESGEITFFEVMNQEYIHPDLAKEAMRVFGLFAKKPWNPTTLDGVGVKSNMILPVLFKLMD
jgi:antitoxin component YwqK of YwqJK toxin-antitoxin module